MLQVGEVSGKEGNIERRLRRIMKETVIDGCAVVTANDGLAVLPSGCGTLAALRCVTYCGGCVGSWSRRGGLFVRPMSDFLSDGFWEFGKAAGCDISLRQKNPHFFPHRISSVVACNHVGKPGNVN